MKSITICIILSALIAVAVSSSPRYCGGGCDVCPQVNCKCGSYKGECGCCDVCYKCPNEKCEMVAGDVCQDGFTCGDPNRDYIKKINEAATCIPKKQ